MTDAAEDLEKERLGKIEEAKALGIKSPHLMSDETLAQRIADARANQTSANTNKQEQLAKSGKKLATRADKKYALIEFSEKPRSTDQEIVSVGVNGRKWRMRRNTPIPVPREVIDVLKNARHPVPEKDDGQGATLQVRRRKIVDFAPRFPFTMLSWISEEEYNRLRAISHERDITKDEINDLIY